MTELREKSRSVNLWLIGIIIILAAVALAQGWVIFSRPDSRSDSHFVQHVLDRASRWIPFNSSRIRSSPFIPVADQHFVWESADEIHRIQEQIRKLFDELSDKSAQPFAGPAFRDISPANMVRLQREINKVFEDASRDNELISLPGRFDRSWEMVRGSSSMNVVDQGSNYLVSVMLSGCDKSALNVSLQGRLLTIVANRERENPAPDPQNRLNGLAGAHGRYETRVMLPGPVNADAVQATFDNSVLRVNIPKSPGKEAPVKSINVI